MKVYITKYALTSGVVEMEVKLASGDPTMVTGFESFLDCFHKPDWHETKEEANARVQVMLDAKIKSVKKQLAKLENLKKSPAFT